MSRTPRYLDLYEKYRRQILSGVYRLGDAFPTERALETAEGCDRKTIRKALTLLTDDGLLTRVVGKGTFVREPDLTLSLETIQGFSGLMENAGVTVTSRVLFFQKVPAGYRISRIMGLPEEAAVHKMVRLRLADGVPVSYEITFIRDVVPGLEVYDFNIYSLYDVLEKNGQIISHISETVTAVELSEAMASHLQKKAGDPVFLLTDITENQEGLVIEYNRSYIVSERFHLSTDLV